MRDLAMIDIETLGTDPGCVVLSIGACRFDPVEGVDQRDTFYTEIDRASSRKAGLEVDPDTLEWWQNQDPELRPFLDGAEQYWANSPSFDLKILEAAYEAVDLSPPWRYWEWRDVRTIRDLPAAVELTHDGREHHALDDAIHQAREISLMLRRIDDAVEVEP